MVEGTKLGGQTVSCEFLGIVPMSQRRTLKLLHVLGTAWLVFCLGCILVLVLRQAGLDWWVIFSLSGYSAVFIFFLLSLYLFAIFRGAGKSQQIEVEHPLTSSFYYAGFYVLTPILGGIAASLGMIGADSITQYVLGVSLGTLGMTFLGWVVVDPALGMLEMFLPASRNHRTERLAQLRKMRQEHQQQQKDLLAKVLEQEQREKVQWQQALEAYAEKLSALLASDAPDWQEAENEAVGMGVSAWKLGGLSCMRELRDMTLARCQDRPQDAAVADYLSSWWDGIGSWRYSVLS